MKILCSLIYRFRYFSSEDDANRHQYEICSNERYRIRQREEVVFLESKNAQKMANRRDGPREKCLGPRLIHRLSPARHIASEINPRDHDDGKCRIIELPPYYDSKESEGKDNAVAPCTIAGSIS